MRFLATMGKCECIDALNDQSFADVFCIYGLPPGARRLFGAKIPQNVR